MKKTVPIIILIILLFTSCVNPFVKFPEGSWESADKKIVLNFSADPCNEYAGTFEEDGKVNKIVWMLFGENDTTLYIRDVSALIEDGGMRSIDLYIAGVRRYEGDRFILTVKHSKTAEYAEGDEIVFVRCEKIDENWYYNFTPFT